MNSIFRLRMVLCVAIFAPGCSSIEPTSVTMREHGAWPFEPIARGLRYVDTAKHVGLANAHVGVLLSRDDGQLLGVWSGDGWNLVQPGNALWRIELMPADGPDPVAIDAPAPSTVIRHGNGIELHYNRIAVGEHVMNVVARLSLRPKDQWIRWRLSADVVGDGASVWQVSYPQLSLRGPDTDAMTNQLLIPHRRGLLIPLGRGKSAYEMRQPYPSSSAHYQFVAMYGEQTGHGFFVGTPDEQGYRKVFREKPDPRANAVNVFIEHEPTNRGVGGTGFDMPYEVVTGPYVGDWWHAARMYRQWWLNTRWARKGLIRDRSDIPDWLKRSAAATRFSTTSDRTVDANLQGAAALHGALDGRPTFGIWYGPLDRGVRASLDNGGHGHRLPPKPGLAHALPQVKTLNMHTQAYVQSLLYDITVDEADLEKARPFAAHDRAGEPTFYPHNKNLYNMCRSTDWWQSRVATICNDWMALGFEGIYLDSFGRGSTECFRADHGHAIGGGNVGLQGQRRLAQRVLHTIRKKNPEAILSGEAPVEAYRDILHVNLYAINVRINSPPIFRAIWGDYSLGHGRTLRLSKPGDNWIPETTYLFLEGTIFGRIFCSQGDHFFLQPEHADKLAFLKKLIAYTDAGIEYLRFGEYLHPLELTPTPPTVKFTEGVLNRYCELPAIMNSVTRSYADGSVAIVLVNVSEQPLSVTTPIDPALRSAPLQRKHPKATISRMDQTGSFTPITSLRQPTDLELTLAPAEIVFLVMQ